MTASITPCWKKLPERVLAICLVLWLSLGVALAASIEPKQATLLPDERGHVLNAEFAIRLGPRLEEAVGLGVPLEFRLEFVLTRKRRYWVDEHVAGRVLNYRLSYHALTRQFRLSLGGLHQSFATLDEALQVLGRVARLQVVDAGRLTPGETYSAALRLSLDHNQLPRPLQVDALADRDWRVEAKTLRWEFTYLPEQ